MDGRDEPLGTALSSAVRASIRRRRAEGLPAVETAAEKKQIEEDYAEEPQELALATSARRQARTARRGGGLKADASSPVDTGARAAEAAFADVAPDGEDSQALRQQQDEEDEGAADYTARALARATTERRRNRAAHRKRDAEADAADSERATPTGAKAPPPVRVTLPMM